MLERFFGGPPAAVITRLIVISIIVGVILSAIGVSPFEIIDSLRRLADRIYNMGFEAVEWVFAYFWLGAIIVFPVWAIARLWALFAREDGRRPGAGNKSESDRMADTPPPGTGS